MNDQNKPAAVLEGWKEWVDNWMGEYDVVIWSEAYTALLAAAPPAPQAEEAPAAPKSAFLEHLANASKIVEGWPAWKKNLWPETSPATESDPTSRVQPSIDTPEFREMLMCCHLFFRFNREDYIQKLISHIDAKLTQVRRDGWIAMESAACNAEARSADDQRARAEKAEAQLASVRAGVDDIRVVHRMNSTGGTRDTIYRDEVLALFKGLPG